jgi:hypothetical protein
MWYLYPSTDESRVSLHPLSTRTSTTQPGRANRTLSHIGDTMDELTVASDALNPNGYFRILDLPLVSDPV